MEKYKIVLTGPTGSKAPDYILNLRMHIKAYFSQPYGKEEFGHVLHCISSFIDDYCLKVFNLGDEKVILTVSFTPLET